MSSDGSSSSLPLPFLPLSSPEDIAVDPSLFLESSAWSNSVLARSHPTTPRSQQPSPRSVFAGALRGCRLPSSRGTVHYCDLASILSSLLRSSERVEREVGSSQSYGARKRKDSGWLGRQHGRKPKILVWVGVVVSFFLVNWWMFSMLPHDPSACRKDLGVCLNSTLPDFRRQSLSVQEKQYKIAKVNRPHQVMYHRLLALAARALADAEGKAEPRDLWKEIIVPTVSWKPCADKRSWEPSEAVNGYILVGANGGISQQRVAICNAVAIARLLNSTLVLPKFLFSNVWQDTSQFGDIYQEEHFINYLKPDIKIVKELPVELQSLDLEKMGNLITDAEVIKEAKLSFYMKKILPILLKNKVVHFTGFGNRLAFDPIPFDLQRLRCRCNFHALRFVSKIQEAGTLLVERMRSHMSQRSLLEHNLLGPSAANSSLNAKVVHPTKASRYLALHLRFEIDMVAYSLCYFGGGKEEEEELEAFREVHFPQLNALRNTSKMPSPDILRFEGQCPLTPEEAILMLAALGFKRKTKFYIAGANIYGGKLRMAALNSLYPNMATKESLLSPSEIEPFRNFSSQLAALDFIACAASDVFAMTDSGSQLSSLVAGYRMYFGGGRYPTIRPNKRRLVAIFAKNSTIDWKQFESRVRKTVRQSKKGQQRPVATSVYRHPRCIQCMCPVESL